MIAKVHIDVVKAGLQTTFQDAGRPGFAHFGIGRSGAFDTPALRIANALCGNPRDACALEMTLLGPTLRFRHDARIAVTGAPTVFRIDGVDAPMWAPVWVRADTHVELGAMRSGCRAYLAVAGGFEVDAVLGSRSTDANSHLGPCDGQPLQAGDVLRYRGGRQQRQTGNNRATVTPHWSIDSRPWTDDDSERPLRLLPGTHLDNLTSTSRKDLFSRVFTVLKDSNRVGLRLGGRKLEWVAPIEMVSEGCVPGLLQLPPQGLPIAFGPECPVSGGYPRLGQIAAVDLPRLAQRRPGNALRFRPCTLEDAWHALRESEHALRKMETAITLRLHAT